MPELPEVETVRRGLSPVMAGRRIERAIQNRPDLRFPLPQNFAARLTGRRVGALERRAKYLLIALDGEETLLAHLGMSGPMLIETPADRAGLGDYVHGADAGGKHDHVILVMEGGARVVFNDARRFGAMDLWPSADLDAHPWLAKLGPEPLSNEFSPASLAAAFAGKRTPLKSALLDQRLIAGLGNIYVCEALWRARLSPQRAAGSLTAAESAALHGAIRAVLEEAIMAGGSSLKDYRQADGELGYFQHAFAVYGREGEPCKQCGGAIMRSVQAGRSTFFCPASQPDA